MKQVLRVAGGVTTRAVTRCERYRRARFEQARGRALRNPGHNQARHGLPAHARSRERRRAAHNRYLQEEEPLSQRLPLRAPVRSPHHRGAGEDRDLRVNPALAPAVASSRHPEEAERVNSRIEASFRFSTAGSHCAVISTKSAVTGGEKIDRIRRGFFCNSLWMRRVLVVSRRVVALRVWAPTARTPDVANAVAAADATISRRLRDKTASAMSPSVREPSDRATSDRAGGCDTRTASGSTKAGITSLPPASISRAARAC